eukprot:c23841_g1_i1 orf=104-1228(+)
MISVISSLSYHERRTDRLVELSKGDEAQKEHLSLWEVLSASCRHSFMDLLPLYVVLSVCLLFLLLLLLFIWFIRQPRPVKIPIKNRHVLITGGSSGIGLEVAKLAAAEGATVTILGRDRGRLVEGQRAIEDFCGHRARALSADVREFESVTRAIEEAGPVDILLCSHGYSLAAPLEEASLDDINEMIDTNLKGCIHVIKAVLPCMTRRTDRHPAAIALFSSQAGQAGLYGYSAYSASKFALRGLADGLQQELFLHNIRVSVIYPPDTYTPGFLKENESKPEITKVLSSSSSPMDAIDVARKCLRGIKAGRFNVSCNFDGFMLSTISAGMAPQPSFVHACFEVFLPGIFRIIALSVIWGWYRKVANWHCQQKNCV